jgi:Fic family protein
MIKPQLTSTMIDGRGAPAAPMMSRGLLRQMFRKPRFQMIDDTLILIGILIVVFLAIHPFKDGNGRLSRVLTTLLLLRAGYGYVPYSSMETIIEANKDSYYIALRRTQQTIRKEEQSWEPWLIFFLKTMAKQKDNLAAKVKDEQALRSSCPRSLVRYWSSRKRAARLPSRKLRKRRARTATPSRYI